MAGRPKGLPKTGGRKPGVPNKLTVERQAQVAASGLTPLDYMLRVMRDEQADDIRRADMAKAAAPYVHPRLASTELTGKDGGPLRVEVVKFDTAT